MLTETIVYDKVTLNTMLIGIKKSVKDGSTPVSHTYFEHLIFDTVNYRRGSTVLIK